MEKKKRTANINKRSRCSGEVSIAIVLHCKQKFLGDYMQRHSTYFSHTRVADLKPM